MGNMINQCMHVKGDIIFLKVCDARDRKSLTEFFAWSARFINYVFQFELHPFLKSFAKEWGQTRCVCVWIRTPSKNLMLCSCFNYTFNPLTVTAIINQELNALKNQ